MTGLGRAGFYRWRVPRQATPVEMELRDQMQKVALESPAYGYRRIAAELQQRGFEVNHKRVLRMMREAGSPLGAAVRAAACLRGHDGLAAQPAGLPEPGPRDHAHGGQPALDR
jgi:transposase InsO family protein